MGRRQEGAGCWAASGGAVLRPWPWPRQVGAVGGKEREQLGDVQFPRSGWGDGVTCDGVSGRSREEQGMDEGQEGRARAEVGGRPQRSPDSM